MTRWLGSVVLGPGIVGSIAGGTVRSPAIPHPRSLHERVLDASIIAIAGLEKASAGNRT